MANNKKLTLKWVANDFDWYGDNYIAPAKQEYIFQKDFSVLQDFTNEELAEELCRRTSLGKELE